MGQIAFLSLSGHSKVCYWFISEVSRAAVQFSLGEYVSVLFREHSDVRSLYQAAKLVETVVSCQYGVCFIFVTPSIPSLLHSPTLPPAFSLPLSFFCSHAKLIL